MRQEREFKYHQEHAKKNREILNKPISYDILHQVKRRWWNAHWEMHSFLLKQDLEGKKVLVAGCGFGYDALYLAKIGADVEAFDLSPDSLAIARKIADREGFSITFRVLPAEALTYDSDLFDCIVARDVLHHVDIPKAMEEIVRVSKDGALFVFNEIYSHSFADRIRHSGIVEHSIYPLLQNFVYKGEKPYITEDERKLNETDILLITKPLKDLALTKYFSFIVTRLVPDKYTVLNKFDRILLALMNPIGKFVAGRILAAGFIKKQNSEKRSV